MAQIEEAFRPAREHYQAFYNRISKLESLIIADLKLAVDSEVECIDRIESRTKKFISIRDNYIDKRGLPPEPISLSDFVSDVGDVIGIRVVVFYDSDVDRLARQLHQTYTNSTLDDKLTVPDMKRGSRFGYRAAHINFRYSDSAKIGFDDIGSIGIEIQVRTLISDAWARHSHKLVYVSGEQPSDRILRKFSATAALMEQIDESIEETRKSIKHDSVELKPVAFEFKWIEVIDYFQKDMQLMRLELSEADIKELYLAVSEINGWKDDPSSVTSFAKLIESGWKKYGLINFEKYGFRDSLVKLRICLFGLEKDRYQSLIPMHMQGRISTIVEVGDRTEW